MKVIPCPSCKEHYEVYLKEHPVDKIVLTIPYTELKNYVKTWFWELHNWVNESIDNPIFSFADLTPTYSSVPIRQRMRMLDVPISKAIRIRSGQLLGYKEFVKQVTILLSIYGI